MFINASSLEYHPTADDLRPLMHHPALVVLLIQYREGLGNRRGAIWNVGKANWGVTDSKVWLNEQFTSFGFKPQA